MCGWQAAWLEQTLSLLREPRADPAVRVLTPRLLVISSHRMYSLISCRKSTLPPNRQLNILISNSTQLVDDSEGELTLTDAFAPPGASRRPRRPGTIPSPSSHISIYLEPPSW